MPVYSSSSHEFADIDGECLLFGIFPQKNSSMDLMFKDQVMILVTELEPLLNGLRGYTILELMENKFYRGRVFTSSMNFDSFVEEAIKIPSCVIVVETSDNETMKYASDVSLI